MSISLLLLSPALQNPMFLSADMPPHGLKVVPVWPLRAISKEPSALLISVKFVAALAEDTV